MNKVNTKISDQYDFYYAGADESLYNRRFRLLKPRTTIRERQLLRLHLQQAVKFAPTTSIRIIDFGCGNGRTILPLYQLALTYTDYKFDIDMRDLKILRYCFYDFCLKKRKKYLLAVATFIGHS